MTHNEKRTDWWKEGFAALISGIFYGASNSIVGSPLDVIKTKMQVLPYLKEKNSFQVFKYIFQTYGLKGYFKGLTGPLIGSSIFRAVQFATFEAFYTKAEKIELLKKKISYTFGLEYRVILGGIISGSCRSIIENPFELTKVKRQTNQTWRVNDLYVGYKANLFKCTGLMTVYFIIIDFFRRNTNAFNSKFKLFLVNGGAASIGFVVIWPIEIVKNKVQSLNIKKYSVYKMIKERIKSDGYIKSMYRGLGPGIGSVFLRNGAAMIVMQYTQHYLTILGFRK